MDIIGSYLNVQQNAIVYSYDIDILGPLGIKPHASSIKSDSVFHNSCVIIENNGSKYVMCNRQKIILCKKYELYYCKYGQLIYKNDLVVLFQSIETDIVLLGTSGYNELRLDLSELVKGNIDYISNYDSDIPAIILTNKFTLPKIKKKYYSNMIMIDFNTHKYHQMIYQFIFCGPIIHTHHYLPSKYMYEFQLTNSPLLDKKNIKDICGSFIFDSNENIIGVISQVTSNLKFIVLPTKHIYKIINIFYDNQDSYSRSLCLPVTYQIKNNELVIKNVNYVSDLNFENDFSSILSLPMLKPNDKIVSIDNKNIIITKGIPTIYDNDYKDAIPIDIYLRLNLNSYSMMNISIKKRKNIISYNFRGVPIEDNMQKLTAQNDFGPINLIPHYNLEGLIITEFTHELLEILAENKIMLNNCAIDDFFNSNELENKKIEYLLIISKLNKTKKNLNIKTNFTNNYNIIDCFVLDKINGKKIKELKDIEFVIEKKNTLEIK